MDSKPPRPRLRTTCTIVECDLAREYIDFKDELKAVAMSVLAVRA
jgi:hypothetical protein